MEEKEKIAIAQDWVRKLANGINPLNGNVLKDDDVVNNVHISRCLFYVADLLGKYVHKGDQLGIEGHIQTRNYEDKDGKKVYITEVMVDSLDFLQSKKEQSNEPKVEAAAVDPYKDFGEAIEISDDSLELPF